MTVPLTLLGLLEREPSHGYDLKRDFDTYFGRGKPLPYGQVYATLARLARDGKAVAGEAEPGGGPDRRGRGVAGRTLRTRAAPADRTVRQGGAGADARPSGRGLPRRPARGAPAPDAGADRGQAGRPAGGHAARRLRPVPPGGRPALDRHDD